MSTRRRDIRTERQARELARWAGWGTPMPSEREAEEPGDEEPAPDARAAIDAQPNGAYAQAGAA